MELRINRVRINRSRPVYSSNYVKLEAVDFYLQGLSRVTALCFTPLVHFTQSVWGGGG